MGQRRHHHVTFSFVALAAVSYSLMQSLVVPSLVQIQHDLHTSTTAVTWIITAYLLTTSVATPIAGRLGDMLGRKRALVATLLILIAGTVLAGVADSIALLIAGRAVQGVGGAIFPLAFAIVRDEFPREKVTGGIAMMASILGVGGGLGIVLAGPIAQHLSYHWLFWIPLVPVVVGLLGTLAFVPESPERPGGRIDWAGALLLSGWLLALLLGVSQGVAWGWGSARVLGLFAAAAALFALWIAVEDRVADPLVDMHMLRHRTVLAGNVATVLLGFGFFAAFVLVPRFAVMPRSTGYGFGSSVTGAALLLLPTPLCQLLVTPLSSRLSRVYGSKVPLVAGVVAALAAFVELTFAHGSILAIEIGMGLQGAGSGLALAALPNLMVEAVRRDQTAVATGMNAIMRAIGSSIGTQVCATIVAASALGATGLPRERGFTIAFVLCAATSLGALAAGLLIPSRRRARRAPLVAGEPAPVLE